MRAVAPISAVIATRNRAESVVRTLDSLLEQDLLPSQLIVVDASDDNVTRHHIDKFRQRVAGESSAIWLSADVAGAAPQRNQGVAHATQPFIWFFDDDIIFQPNCAQRLWRAIELDRQLGGVNAMIVNQRYQPPGFLSWAVFTLMHGQREKSFAGKVIGPAINLLPEDHEDLPDVVPVEWLNTTCTLYRREALPSPPFDSFFSGYSMMEDLALSVRVARDWKLANVRSARIRHESQLGTHKEDARAVAKMEMINRLYVMVNLLSRSQPMDYLRLGLWETFATVSTLAEPSGIRDLPNVLAGKFDALRSFRSLPRVKSN